MGNLALNDLSPLVEAIRSISGLLIVVAALMVLCEIGIFLGSLISLRPPQDRRHRG